MARCEACGVAHPLPCGLDVDCPVDDPTAWRKAAEDSDGDDRDD